MTQPELPFTASKAEVTRKARSRALVSYLCHAGKWCTRNELGSRLGMTMRQLREARQYSDGAVIYGQAGFKAFSAATSEEQNHCIADLLSRAQRYGEQATAITRRVHRMGRD